MARGLVSSRHQATSLVEQGSVLVSGSVATKPARLVATSEPIVLLGPPPRFVSRGGEKLAAALDRFAVDVAGARALDAGASTGGFTDCLLQYGAASVLAVDVGRGQLDQRLRDDPRVTSRERTDIRELSLEAAGGMPFDVVTADLSFISLAGPLAALAGPLARPLAHLVLLVKPQFEAGRAEASRGRGVIRDPAVHARTLGSACAAVTAAGAAVVGAMPSPLTGQAGNIEFLVHALAHTAPRWGPEELAAAVAAAVAEAHAIEDAPAGHTDAP